MLLDELAWTLFCPTAATVDFFFFFAEYDENCCKPENSSLIIRQRFCWTKADLSRNHHSSKLSFKTWLKSCVVFMIRKSLELFFYRGNSERKDWNPLLDCVNAWRPATACGTFPWWLWCCYISCFGGSDHIFSHNSVAQELKDRLG